MDSKKPKATRMMYRTARRFIIERYAEDFLDEFDGMVWYLTSDLREVDVKSKLRKEFGISYILKRNLSGEYDYFGDDNPDRNWYLDTVYDGNRSTTFFIVVSELTTSEEFLKTYPAYKYLTKELPLQVCPLCRETNACDCAENNWQQILHNFIRFWDWKLKAATVYLLHNVAAGLKKIQVMRLVVDFKHNTCKFEPDDSEFWTKNNRDWIGDLKDEGHIDFRTCTVRWPVIVYDTQQPRKKVIN